MPTDSKQRQVKGGSSDTEFWHHEQFNHLVLKFSLPFSNLIISASSIVLCFHFFYPPHPTLFLPFLLSGCVVSFSTTRQGKVCNLCKIKYLSQTRSEAHVFRFIHNSPSYEFLSFTHAHLACTSERAEVKHATNHTFTAHNLFGRLQHD